MTGNLCETCKHFNANVVHMEVCTAYPEGIPKVIMLNEVDHRKPVGGDHGIQYEVKPGLEWVVGADS